MTYQDNFNYDKYDKILTIDLADAAYNNDLDKIKECFTKEKPPDIHHKDEIALLAACQGGYLDIVDFLLTDPSLKEHSYINGYLEGQEVPYTDSPLSLAALHNQIDTVKYLLTSENLKHKASLRIRGDLAFRAACQCPTTEMIDYFCYSHELKEHVNLKEDHTFFQHIFQFGTIENLEYVLEKNIVGYPNAEALKTCFEKLRFHNTNTTQKLNYLFSLKGSEAIDIYHHDNEFFKRAIENKDLEVLTYIIIEHDVKIYSLENVVERLLDPKNHMIKNHVDKSLLYHSLHQKVENKSAKEKHKQKL